MGRFNGEDPLLFGGGDVNFYSYVGNNPAYYTDPLGMDRKAPARQWTNSAALPPDSVIEFAPSGWALIAPPNLDFCKEYNHGLANHRNISAVGPAIGEGGTYDWQRNATTHLVYSEYQDVANYGVGVYMNAAGYSRSQTIAMGLTYAAINAKNFSWGMIQYWTKWWGQGWDDAHAGAFAGCGCMK